jgi:hypothetical protein
VPGLAVPRARAGARVVRRASRFDE